MPSLMSHTSLKASQMPKRDTQLSFLLLAMEREEKAHFVWEARTRHAGFSLWPSLCLPLCLPASLVTSPPQNRLDNICLSESGAGKQDGNSIEILTISFFKNVFHSNSSANSLIVANLPRQELHQPHAHSERSLPSAAQWPQHVTPFLSQGNGGSRSLRDTPKAAGLIQPRARPHLCPETCSLAMRSWPYCVLSGWPVRSALSDRWGVTEKWAERGFVERGAPAGLGWFARRFFLQRCHLCGL